MPESKRPGCWNTAKEWTLKVDSIPVSDAEAKEWLSFTTHQTSGEKIAAAKRIEQSLARIAKETEC